MANKVILKHNFTNTGDETGAVDKVKGIELSAGEVAIINYTDTDDKVKGLVGIGTGDNDNPILIYDKERLERELTILDNKIEELPKDNFLENASYDPQTHKLTLTMVEGDPFVVDLDELIDVYVADDTSIKLVDNNKFVRSALIGDVTAAEGSSNTSILNTVVTGKTLSGYTVGSDEAIANGDTILGAFGKAQGQINKITGDITSLNTTIDGLGDSKQDKLTAGTNIDITGTTISATDTKYTAGQGIKLTETVFSVEVTKEGTGDYVKSISQTEDGVEAKMGTMPTYSAGTNISVTGTGAEKTINSTLVGSDSVTIESDGQIQRAALTGDVTASKNDNKTSIADTVVVGKKLTGLNIPSAGSDIADTDSIVEAFGKIQKQIQQVTAGAAGDVTEVQNQLNALEEVAVTSAEFDASNGQKLDFKNKAGVVVFSVDFKDLPIDGGSFS